MGVESNFYFTWVGQEWPVVLSVKESRRRRGEPQGYQGEEHSRQMGEKFSNPGGRNMLGAVCPRKDKIVKMGGAE